MTLTEFAREADLPKSTALRFGVYSLGAAIAGLAAQYLAGDPLVTVATSYMRDETISLSRRIGLTRVCVQKFFSTQNLRLAEHRFITYTGHTITDIGRLGAEAKKVLDQGPAVTRGQKTEGAVAIAAPLQASREVAALGVFGPQVRCSTKRDEERWRKALLTTAGSFVRRVWAKPGDHQCGDFGPLGMASARFT